jgi:hypothetical protein
METQLLITFVSHSSGVRISVIESSLTKSQSVCHSSKSRVLLNKQRTVIHTRMLSHTLRLAGTLHLPTSTMTLMLSKAKPGIFCDYCKSRFGIHNPKGMTQAGWTVTSELPKSHGRKRSYCNDCAIDVSKWADGSYFSLDQQIEYAKTNGNTTQGVLNGF